MVLISENLVSEKGLGFGFGGFVSEKVSVSENLVLKKSLGFGFGKLDLEKEKRK